MVPGRPVDGPFEVEPGRQEVQDHLGDRSGGSDQVPDDVADPPALAEGGRVPRFLGEAQELDREDAALFSDCWRDVARLSHARTP